MASRLSAKRPTSSYRSDAAYPTEMLKVLEEAVGQQLNVIRGQLLSGFMTRLCLRGVDDDRPRSTSSVLPGSIFRLLNEILTESRDAAVKKGGQRNVLALDNYTCA